MSKNPLGQKGELATTLAIISLIVMTIGIIVGTGSLEKVKKFFGFAAGEKGAICYYAIGLNKANDYKAQISGEPYECSNAQLQTGPKSLKVKSVTVSDLTGGARYHIVGNYKNVDSGIVNGQITIFSRDPSSRPGKLPTDESILAPGKTLIDLHNITVGETSPDFTADIDVSSSWVQTGCPAGAVTANLYTNAGTTSGGASPHYFEMIIDLAQYPHPLCQPTPTIGGGGETPPVSETPIPSPTIPCPLNESETSTTSQSNSPCPGTPTPATPTPTPECIKRPDFGFIDPSLSYCPEETPSISETPAPTEASPAPQACMFTPVAFLKDPLCRPISNFDGNGCYYGVSNDKFRFTVADPNFHTKDLCYNRLEGKVGANWKERPREGSVFKNGEYKVNIDLTQTMSYRQNQSCCVSLGDTKDPLDPSGKRYMERTERDQNGNFLYTYPVGDNPADSSSGKASVKVYLGNKQSENPAVWNDFAIPSKRYEVMRQECAGPGCPPTDQLGVIVGDKSDSVKNLQIACSVSQKYGWILKDQNYDGLYKATCLGKCPYDAVNSVQIVDGSGTDVTSNYYEELNNISVWGTANNKNIARTGDLPDAFFENGKYKHCDDQGKCKLSVHADNQIFAERADHPLTYQKGSRDVFVKLYYDQANFEIVGRWCRGVGCPTNTAADGSVPLGTQPDKIIGFLYDCGTNVDYGWILKDKRQVSTPEPTGVEPTSPVPTNPNPTNPPESCTFDSVNYVRDTSGNLITDFDFDKPNGTNYGTANNKKFVIQDKPQAFFKNGIFFLCDINGQNCKSKIHTTSLTFPTKDDGYQKGELANVKLYYPGQTGGWRIVGQECRGMGCPSSTKSDGTIDDISNQIKGIKINCGTNVEYGWILEKSNSLTPTVTPPVPPTDVTLDMQLRFQGIVSQSQVGNVKSPQALVRVGLAEGSLSEPVYNKDVAFNMDAQGIWHGTTTFRNISVDPSLKYKVLVKAPMHLQRKVCDQLPPQGRDEQIEDVQFSRYLCRRDIANIVLSAGVNNLDFSNILEYTGDLPIPQDGVVNSYDIVAMREIIKSRETTNPDLLQLADLNRDGDVNADDQALIVAALQIAQDEYEVAE